MDRSQTQNPGPPRLAYNASGAPGGIQTPAEGRDGFAMGFRRFAKGSGVEADRVQLCARLHGCSDRILAANQAMGGVIVTVGFIGSQAQAAQAVAQDPGKGEAERSDARATLINLDKELTQAVGMAEQIKTVIAGELATMEGALPNIAKFLGTATRDEYSVMIREARRGLGIGGGVFDYVKGFFK